jgi:uncharacterized protein
MNLEITHDIERRRFRLTVEGDEAHLAYSELRPGVLDFHSTYVPPAHRGHKLAERLVAAGFAYAREHGYKVVPSCWYVARKVAEKPEYEDMIV